MSSATSDVRQTLEGYLAGRVQAERVVEAVSDAYYKEPGARSRERLRAIMHVIERAHPGVVELTGSPERPGYAVRLKERPFPKEHEARLRQAIEGALAEMPAPTPSSPPPTPGLWARLSSAMRRLFTAST
jgi:hypothetical protein